MSKILKIKKEVRNLEYSKAWNKEYNKQSKFWKFGNAFVIGGLWLTVLEPEYIKNPRIAEIFGQDINVVKNWHISDGYFYIEVLPGFKTKEGEVYEIKQS